MYGGSLWEGLQTRRMFLLEVSHVIRIDPLKGRTCARIWNPLRRNAALLTIVFAVTTAIAVGAGSSSSRQSGFIEASSISWMISAGNSLAAETAGVAPESAGENVIVGTLRHSDFTSTI